MTNQNKQHLAKQLSEHNQPSNVVICSIQAIAASACQCSQLVEWHSC